MNNKLYLKSSDAQSSGWSRRHFVATLGATLAVSGIAPVVLGAENKNALFPIGACTGVEQWPAVQKGGGSYIEGGVGKLLNPKLSDPEFAATVEPFKAAAVPVQACNGFIPAELKFVGPDAKHDEIVAYATKALKRARTLGIKILVLGSGSARKVPDGFDFKKAEEQFVSVVRSIGQAAREQNVTVAMESLNKSETNFGNTVRDCAKLIRAVNHPNVRLTADMYHMLKEEEGPEAIVEAGSLIVHCHIAEKAARTPPGTDGDDFRPFLRALSKINYQGRISLECRWKDFAAEVGPAIRALKAQMETV